MISKSPSASTTKSTGLAAVFLVVMVDLVGFGIILPLLPTYAKTFGVSALMAGLLFSVYSLMQFIFSPIWGSISDRWGRRPVMLVSTCGACIAYLIFAFTQNFWLLFCSRTLAGMMGGNISAAQAYIADVTSEKDRVKGMGLLGAAFGIGFALGPALTAVLMRDEWFGLLDSLHFSQNWISYLRTYPYTAPGCAAFLLSLLSFVLILFHLPESKHHQSEITSQMGSRHLIFTTHFWKSLIQQDTSKMISWLMVSMLILSFCQASLYGIFPLFCNDRFGLGPADIGVLYIVMGVVAILVQGGLLRSLSKRFPEKALFLCGACCLTVGLMSLAIASELESLVMALILMTLGVSFAVPTLQSMISKRSPTNLVGTYLGTAHGMAGLGRVMGPIWGGLLYPIAIAFPFWGTAIVSTFVLWVALKLRAYRVAGNSTGRE